MGTKPLSLQARQKTAKPILETLEARDVPAVTVRFDYRFDTSHFFDDPTKRQLLEQAAAAITPTITDSLAAISPDAVNTWSISFTNLATGKKEKLVNPRVNADEITVFVFGAPLPGNTLARELEWSYSSYGYPDWHNTIRGRGQTGALGNVPTDFGPWGGLIAFDTNSPFSTNPNGPTANTYDFLSVAEHELMHVLGFGANNPSFARNVSANGVFVGSNVTAANGGVSPTVVQDDSNSYPDHWAQTTKIDGQTPTMVPILDLGAKNRISRLELAALKDIGWQLNATTTPSVVAVPPVVPTPTPAPRPSHAPIPAATKPTTVTPPVAATPVPAPAKTAVIVGYTTGEQAYVGALDKTGTLLFADKAFPAGVGVKVATGDFNGDGTDDIVLGSTQGNSSLVKVLDGKTRMELFSLTPFEKTFTGGVNVAVGDITGDGRADLVVTPDIGGGPRVRVWDGVNHTAIADFFGIEDPNFRGGARATIGDANGDGINDLYVAAGQGGGPRVALFQGQSIRMGNPLKLVGDFFAAPSDLRDGVMLAAGDVTNDGIADLVVGTTGWGATAFVLDGKNVATGNAVPSATLPIGMVSGRTGLQVAVTDVNDDGRADIVLGTDVNGRVKALRGLDYSTLFDINVLPGQVALVSVA